MRHKRLGISATLLAVMALALWSMTRPNPAPEVDFILTDGRTLSLSSLRGRPVLITFWASSCPSCLAEMPHLAELYRELSPAGLELIGVAMPYEPPSAVLETVRRRSLPYPISLDLEAKLVRAFDNVRVTPTSVLISPTGEILFQRAGPLHMAQLQQTLNTLLNKN